MYLVVLSPRVAPGLLSREAWRIVEAASRVYIRPGDEAHAQALAAAGVAVHRDPGPPWFEADTVWVTSDPAWARESVETLRDEARDEQVSLVPGSFDVVGARVIDLVRVMDRLRRECPWTSQQTHASLSKYVLEEAHEVLESLETQDSEHLKEELGDLLMQVVFHARIAAENEGWTIDDVAHVITEKLKFRNPHVFGDAHVTSAAEVDANWQALKASEKRRTSPWEGIPTTLPALSAAAKILRRLEIADLGEVLAEDDLGRRFLELVAQAEREGRDPETELRRALRALTDS